MGGEGGWAHCLVHTFCVLRGSSQQAPGVQEAQESHPCLNIHEQGESGGQRVDLVVLLSTDASAAYKVTQVLLMTCLLAQVSVRLIRSEVVTGQELLKPH